MKRPSLIKPKRLKKSQIKYLIRMPKERDMLMNKYVLGVKFRNQRRRFG